MTMTDYQAAYRAEYAEFETWAATVAFAMGWEYVAPELQGYAINGWLTTKTMPDFKLALDLDKARGRVEIVPCWPEGTHGLTVKGLPKRISVSYDRPADKAALDVAKRLVGPCRLALVEIGQLLDIEAAKASKRQAAFTRVLGAGGFGNYANVLKRVEHLEAEAGFYGLTNGYGTVKVGHSGLTGSIELHYIPADTLIEIVELLARKEEAGE